MYSALRTNKYMSRYYGACVLLPAETRSPTVSWWWRCAAVRWRDSSLCFSTPRRLCRRPACISPPARLHMKTHIKGRGVSSQISQQKENWSELQREVYVWNIIISKVFFSFFLETASSCRVIFTDGVNTLNPSKINPSTFKKCLFFFIKTSILRG